MLAPGAALATSVVQIVSSGRTIDGEVSMTARLLAARGNLGQPAPTHALKASAAAMASAGARATSNAVGPTSHITAGILVSRKTGIAIPVTPRHGTPSAVATRATSASARALPAGGRLPRPRRDEERRP